MTLELTEVSVAERSKAPVLLQFICSKHTYSFTARSEHSGPRLWAWVRIPPLTQIFILVICDIFWNHFPPLATKNINFSDGRTQNV